MIVDQDTVTIPSGQSLSAAINLGANKTLHGIVMPAGWDAANLTFQVSFDNATSFQEFVDSRAAGVAISSFPAAAGQYLALDPQVWRGVVTIKIRSGTLATPVNQTANRTLALISKQIA